MAISEKQKEKVLARLEAGDSLRTACAQADISEPTTFMQVMKNDPTLQTHYAHARLAGYEARADRLRDDAWDMSIPADHKRIIIDTQKWELSKMLPKIYGERLDLHHSGSASKADQLSVEELQAIIAAKDTPQA